jgi:N,N'-diacetyllegionaminate synthase
MVEVIAEIGSCHDGSLDQALKLIRTAKDCGADIAKVQFWSSAKRMAERRRAPEYEAIYARYQVPVSWLEPMAREAARVGVTFAASSYLPEDVATIAPFVKILKISSFEAEEPQLLAAHRGFVTTRRVIASMGMDADDFPIGYWLDIDGQRRVGRLHCVSAYPAPLDALNLGAIRGRNRDGFSDHSGDIRVGGWAVTAGARIIDWTTQTTPTRTLASMPCALRRSRPTCERSVMRNALCRGPVREPPKTPCAAMRCADAPVSLDLPAAWHHGADRPESRGPSPL